MQKLARQALRIIDLSSRARKAVPCTAWVCRYLLVLIQVTNVLNGFRRDKLWAGGKINVTSDQERHSRQSGVWGVSLRVTGAAASVKREGG